VFIGIGWVFGPIGDFVNLEMAGLVFLMCLVRLQCGGFVNLKICWLGFPDVLNRVCDVVTL
jgi:hypothetical protein